MIRLTLDMNNGPEVTQVEILPPTVRERFVGTIATRTIADFLNRHINLATGATVDGWVNLLDTPAHTAWKVAGDGKLTAITVFPARDVMMQCVRPFLPNYNIRTYTVDEVMTVKCSLGPSVWVGIWNASGALVHTRFAMISPGAGVNPGSFLDTALSDFQAGNVYEHGGLCWGNATLIAPRGNLFALDKFFFEESVNNFHIIRGAMRKWWTVFYGVRDEVLHPTTGRPITYAHALTRDVATAFIRIPETVVLVPGEYSFRLSSLLTTNY